MMVRMTIRIMLLLGWFGFQTGAGAQEKIKLDYSSVDASNAVWYTAQEVGLFKKHGLDSELIYIPSTTTAVSAIIAGEIPLGNASGGGVASAVVGGANLVMVACMLNTLPYELVVHESIKTVEDLRGKNIGISRIGSASDVAARVLVKALGLEPVKDVPILQVGGAPERAGAFRSGRIAGFPSPPGIIKLAEGMPHRVLISTADFQKRFDFPFICATTTKSFLSSRRETAKRVLMALIESTHFFKTRKEESKKIIAKYNRQNNPAYLEEAYTAVAKLYDRVPLVTREGTEVQIKEALARKPGATLRVEDIVDDSIVRELEKSGFIDKVYR
ncbi:MAG: ABC transporter substrate-binding protein [Deltaproteobacteria bacterium]|nr:ABC transporter substrate-binding protein [Deltaproteobacteria bacterium]MBI2531400.1 ABC transporter substrate-binding protein [Deltaproteobacteria bacterium]